MWFRLPSAISALSAASAVALHGDRRRIFSPALYDTAHTISSKARLATRHGLPDPLGLFYSSFPCRVFFSTGLGIPGNTRSQPFPRC